MGGHHRQEQQNHGNGKQSRPNKRRKLMAYCWCPCHAVSSMFRGIGRCMFVSCYPAIQCLGLDDFRHRHHHHKRFNW